MIRKVLFFCWLVISPVIFAGEISIDPSIPAVRLDDNCRLGILNGRMGSRFSFNFFQEKRGIHTGVLGFDADEFSELLVGIEQENGFEVFRFANLPKGTSYLEDQELYLSMTGMQFRGRAKSGLKAVLTVVSPFTPAGELNDTTALKLQIAPAYYLLLKLVNPGAQSVNAKVHIALNRLPYNPVMEYPVWGYGIGRVNNEVFYRDNAGLLSVECLSHKAVASVKGPFTGLQTEVTVAAKSAQQLNYSYAAYYDGKVQRDKRINQDLKFYYTKFWKNIFDVKRYVKEQFEQNMALSEKFENILLNSKLDGQTKWMMALTFKSDLANTFLLLDEKDRPYFYLLEGRFKHQSTVDVAHETEIAALFNPWRLRMQLQQWTNYISFGLVKRETERGRNPFHQGYSAAEYGPYLMHDVGDFPYINETADYDYGPYMAAEENSNYPILLYWYWKISGNDAFVKTQLGLTETLLHSLVNRDLNGNGIVDHAMGWTTFDSSKSLRIYTENTYVAVKQLVAYILAAEMFRKLAVDGGYEIGHLVSLSDGEGQGHKNLLEVPNRQLRGRQAEFYEREATKILSALEKAHKRYGYIPVSLDPKYTDGNQLSVALGDALLYPGMCGVQSPIITKVARLIQKTYEKAYPQSKTSYGITLTTGETPTWYSKIMVSDIVAQRWFGSGNNTTQYVFDHNVNSPYTYDDGQINEQLSWIGYFYPRGVVMLGYFLNEQNFETKRRSEFLKNLVP